MKGPGQGYAGSHGLSSSSARASLAEAEETNATHKEVQGEVKKQQEAVEKKASAARSSSWLFQIMFKNQSR